MGDDEIREELYGIPNDACERLVKKVIAAKKSHQDNVTVAIVGCGDKDPVTVRTRKNVNGEIVQPISIGNARKPLSLILAAAALVILAGVVVYLMKPWDKKDQPKHSIDKIILEQSTSATPTPKLPSQTQKKKSKDDTAVKK